MLRQVVPADERIERALGLLAGTVAAVAVFLASFFTLFGSEAPSGMFPVFVTVTVLVASIPGITAAVRLAKGVSATKGTLLDALNTSAVVTRSIWSGIVINAVFAGLGMVASMGMLIVFLLPYLLVGSAIVAAVAALMGWGSTRVTARKLAG
ncbi:hypothetical protein GCM10009805_13930 [Leucobacter chromiireducens subsp. solipictus]